MDVRKLPILVFGVLTAVTVGAFFVTQHLKVTTPLIAGSPAPFPADINPLNGTTCGGLNHRLTNMSFYLLHRTDDVDVYVVDQGGTIVRTVATGRHMRRGVRNPDGLFQWDGRLDGGSIAPDGTYFFRIALVHQGRTVELNNRPVHVKTVPPHPVVTSVTPSLIPQGSTPVTIRYTGNEQRGGTVRIYRTDLPGKPLLEKSFNTLWKGQVAVWDGTIRSRPAPPGTYLIGLDVTDAACNTGHFPAVLPPAPGATPHAGVTVRYLAAQPPLAPVAAGSSALVLVDSRQHPYQWTLQRVATAKPVAHGSGRSVELRVRLPGRNAGLYTLTLHSSGQQTAVPLIASSQKSNAKVLVVLPALTWQGQNPSDEDGDGVPDTLDVGQEISLARPFARGLPTGLPDQATLLAYLDKAHLGYDLTTDLGLTNGVGPKLKSYRGVVLADSIRWIPDSLASALQAYVKGGGRVLSLGTDTLRRGVTVQSGKALRPTQETSTDTFGAKHEPLVTHSSAPILEITDGLGILSGTSGVLSGFPDYEPISSVVGSQIGSSAGTSTSSPSIVGFKLAQGTVIEVALPEFGSSVTANVGSQELVGHLWTVLSG
jgi:hypothetical protein